MDSCPLTLTVQTTQGERMNTLIETNWIKNTRLYLIGIAITLFGSSLVQYAIIWHITLATQSGIQMTLSAICGFVPQLIISLFAGVWADRYDRKKIVMLSDLMIAAATFILVITFLLGYEELWTLYVILAVRSLGQGIQTPATTSLVPQFVPQDKLLRVNGLVGTIQSSCMLIAPAVSGAILAFAQMETIFMIDIITAIIGVSLISLMKVPPLVRTTSEVQTSVIVELKEGIRYVRDHIFIKEMLAYYAIFMILVVPAAMLSPLQVTRTFGESYLNLTAIEIAFSLGALFGGVIITVWGGFNQKIKTIAFASVLFGVTTALLGVVSHFPIYCITMLIMGLGLPFFNTPTYTLFQESVEPEKLGRVMSLVSIIASSAFPIGMIFFGPLADFVQIEWLMIITGILLTGLGMKMWFDRSLVMKAHGETVDSSS